MVDAASRDRHVREVRSSSNGEATRSRDPAHSRAIPLIAAFGRACVYLAVVVSLLWKGAAIPFPFYATAILVGCALLASLAKLPLNPAAERLFFASLALAGGLASFAWLQSVWTPPWFGQNEGWRSAGALVAIDGGAVSANPAMTREAIPTLVMPFVLFAAALALFQTDAVALRLIRFVAVTGFLFAAFGLVQVTLLPDSLLFFEKRFYRESLTSVLVNRNTAGTLLGIASLAMTTWFVAVWKSVDDRATMRSDRWDEPGMLPTFAQRKNKLVLLALGFATIVVALLLTRSRGAMLAAVCSYLIVLPMLVNVLAWRRHGRTKQEIRRAKLLAIAGAVGSVAAVVLLFGNLTGSRLSEGVDFGRMCVYRATWRMFADHWLLGTGFGTFESVFPTYRQADCGFVQNYFLRAHNFFLEGLAGFGLAFVAAAAFAYARIVGFLRTGYERRRRFRFVAICGAGAVTLATVHGLVDFSLQIPGMAAYLAVLLAACASISLQRETAVRTSTTPDDERGRRRWPRVGF